MLVLVEVGRLLRVRHPKVTGNSPIEGAVFGLFGLLLAFTFSGAVSRYDTHRQLLTQELNHIGTAYLRLVFLPEGPRRELRGLFHDYTTSRLNSFEKVGAEMSPDTIRLQNQIWNRAVAAASSPDASADTSRLLLPALNNMFDITATRQTAFNMHPPDVVFLLLFVFSFGSALLAGYSTPSEQRNWVYSLSISLAVTVTVVATLEIEYPQRGLIRLAHLDQNLIVLRDSMK